MFLFFLLYCTEERDVLKLNFPILLTNECSFYTRFIYISTEKQKAFNWINILFQEQTWYYVDREY